MLNESNLHNYQLACVEHILKTPFCGVFLDMGLGKTVSTLTAINILLYDNLEPLRVLVIAPKRVAESVWAEEASRWEHLNHLTFSKIVGTQAKRMEALKAKADVHIISRDNVAWLCGLYGNTKLPFDMIVVDELSSFKSHNSQRFKSLKSCQPFFKRFVGLTGTPAPNSLIDLWSQIYLMDRGARLGKTITSYRNTYFHPSKTNGMVVYSYGLNDGSEETIHKRISDICISMSAKDYLTLPPVTYNTIKLNMSQKDLAKYVEFEREQVINLYNEAGGLEEISVANAAGLSNKLLQYANGAVYKTDEETGERSVCEVHNVKIEALKEIIEDNNEQPVLVAWAFQSDRNRLMAELAKYSPRELKGADEINEWNKGNIRVLLAHPASAGHGLNLQAGGCTIVWFGLTWSLELYQQFNARLNRQGQKNAVVIHHLCVNGTHDMDVMCSLGSKQVRQNVLMESLKARIDKYVFMRKK